MLRTGVAQGSQLVDCERRLDDDEGRPSPCQLDLEVHVADGNREQAVHHWHSVSSMHDTGNPPGMPQEVGSGKVRS